MLYQMLNKQSKADSNSKIQQYRFEFKMMTSGEPEDLDLDDLTLNQQSPCNHKHCSKLSDRDIDLRSARFMLERSRSISPDLHSRRLQASDDGRERDRSRSPLSRKR